MMAFHCSLYTVSRLKISLCEGRFECFLSDVCEAEDRLFLCASMDGYELSAYKEVTLRR